MNKYKIQEEAENLVKKNGISKAPIPLQHIVMEESDLSIAKTIFEDNTISGFIDFEQKLILINKLDAPARQRFTIAHELGHWILHQKEIQNKNRSDFILYRKTSYIDEKNLLEREANYFAANLLVPEFIFKNYKDYDSATLANIFNVSKNVIELRKIDYITS